MSEMTYEQMERNFMHHIRMYSGLGPIRMAELLVTHDWLYLNPQEKAFLDRLSQVTGKPEQGEP